MSIPPRFAALQMSSAAVRILVHLWQFADNSEADVWVFQTDEQLTDACRLSRATFFRAIADLRARGLLDRESGPDGKPGFRLHSSLKSETDANIAVSKVRLQSLKSETPESQKCDSHLLRSKRAEEQTASQPALFDDANPAPKRKPPRRKSSEQRAKDQADRLRKSGDELRNDPLYPKWERILEAFNEQVRKPAGFGAQRITHRWTAKARVWLEDEGKSVDEVLKHVECLAITVAERMNGPRSVPKYFVDINLVWNNVLRNAFEDHSMQLVDASTPMESVRPLRAIL